MARPKTPTRILTLKGTFKKNPSRARFNEPEPNAEFDPAPPKHLTARQKKTWQEIVKAVPAGVLSDADQFHVEIVSCLLAEFRELKGVMDSARITRLAMELGKLGLNPSARAGMSIPEPRKPNPFDD